MSKRWILAILGSFGLLTVGASLQRLQAADDEDNQPPVVRPDPAPRRDTMAPRYSGSSAGVRASVLLQTSGKGGIRETSGRGTFQDGQRFRLNVRSGVGGYLYILCRTSTDEARLLYPYANMEQDENILDPGQDRMVPSRDWYRFDNDPGLERMYVLVSSEPIAALDRIVAERGGQMSIRTLERYVAMAQVSQNARATQPCVAAPLDPDDEDDAPEGPAVQFARLNLRHVSRQ
jgi:hypothetical protein